MATEIYDSAYIKTIEDLEIYITPLKIKYLREFMDVFQNVKSAETNDDAISGIIDCARVAMKQYLPAITTASEVEDTFDLPTIYKILDIAAGIKLDPKQKDEDVSKQATEEGSSWDKLDLAKLESEVFVLGIWRDYEELETSLSMPELVAILETKREGDYQHKKFLAAIQGIDLDKQTGKAESDAWERMKAKVFSGGKAKDPNDITALQGINAQKAGFGIGMGLGYEDLTKK